MALRPARNKWPDTESARGVMFVAQLFREMLDPSSFESFRVTTLDVVSRLNELSVLLDDATEGRIPPASLEPALSELSWSMKVDPVLCHIASSEANEFADYCGNKNNSKSPDLRYLSSYVSLLKKRIVPTYRKVLEDEIYDQYLIPKGRIKLRILVSFYCSHLVNIGYTKRHIAEVVQQRFFSQPILKVEKRTLSRFFSGFSGEEKNYRFWLSVTADTGAYISRLGLGRLSTVVFTDLPAHAQREVKRQTGFSAKNKYVTGTMPALDEYRALQKLSEVLESISAMTFLGKRSIELSWPDWLYIKTLRSSEGRIINKDGFSFQKIVTTVSGATAKSLQSQTKTILSEFDGRSTERLLSAINTSALARRSSSQENQLISLWSAVEVLISDPPIGKTRITHYVDALAPCICVKYVRRYIIAILDELLKYHSSSTRKALASVGLPLGVDQYSKFTVLIFDKSFKKQCAAYMSEISSNPLALHRLWKLHNNFSTPSKMIISIKEHELRVRWQLHRIYRTRNQLVHAGRVPIFLQPLVMNVFEYFRSATGPVFGRAYKEEGASQIDQIVAELGIDYDLMLKKIQNISSNGDEFQADHFPLFFR